MSFSLFYFLIDDNNEEEDIDMKEDSGIKFIILFLQDRQGSFCCLCTPHIFQRKTK